MLFHSAMRRLETERSHVMYRKGSKKYVHLTTGIQLTVEQTRSMLCADTNEAKKLSYMLVLVDLDLIVPYAPSFDDLMATDWHVKPMELPDAVNTHQGVVRLRADDVNLAVNYMESWGYGTYLTQFANHDGTIMVTFESRLFQEPRAGHPTPEYILTVDTVNETIRAEIAGK